ncbi:MAG: methylenetetrahydrofolate--tRNA-(uracil(54)-C(5))-methyltransferase (FADH(2)-oxidizing) TrmFO [Thermodesulfobacteriota bacterium]
MGGLEVTIIGGGLAGIEAACAARFFGLPVRLYEMKPRKYSSAHTMEGLGELVCSNSLKSLDIETAQGALKGEMRELGSIIMDIALKARVPAGAALAVDRFVFSHLATETLREKGVKVIREEIKEIPSARPLIIATGPLTSEPFAASIQGLLGRDSLFFYDAVSPVVTLESIDMEKAFFGSRYGKGGDDYINCAMNREEYERFIGELTSARRVTSRSFEPMALFEGCMPIESMAERGPDTLTFGPLRPVGFREQVPGGAPYAVVQLRRENLEGTLYNMVGFQTRLTFGEQARVFGMIPGLEKAEFVRYGKLHRNTYIDAPEVLESTLMLRAEPGVFFAGQLTGLEGYCESGASGIIAGINAARFCLAQELVTPPAATMTGALLRHISSPRDTTLQPMNANFGLLPSITGIRKRRDRRRAQALAALESMREWKDKILASE